MILDHSEDNSADAYDVRLGSIASLWSAADYFRSSPVNGRRQGQWHVSKVPEAEIVLLRKQTMSLSQK